MTIAMFDTLEYMDELKSSGIPQEQAEAMTKATAKAFTQMIETKELATKSDILAVRSDMKDLKMDLQGFIVKSITSSILILGGLQTLFHFIK